MARGAFGAGMSEDDELVHKIRTQYFLAVLSFAAADTHFALAEFLSGVSAVLVVESFDA